MVDNLNPANYGPGKTGDQIEWLRERLAAHDVAASPEWTNSDAKAVATFQRRQGWYGSDADGLPGTQTLKRLAADPDEPVGVPGEVLNLTHWKETLPTDRDRNGIPDEIWPPQLFVFEDEDYFHVNDDGTGVVFRAHCGGATTRNSSYPRSELRELSEQRGISASWDSAVGTHTMFIEQAITATPLKKKHVVAGQIHDDADDVVMVRLEGKNLFVESGGDPIGVLDANYIKGTKFTVKITADYYGIVVNYNNGKAIVKLPGKKAKGCYFKAGCYTQSNVSKGDLATSYGEVVIYRLSVTHT